MSEPDIVERLRAWVYTATLYTTAMEAAAEIERLRGDAEIDRLRLEAAHKEADLPAKGLTLTDKEREAIKEAVLGYSENDDDDECASIAATLRSLLERMK